jgi:hypothetical protein
MAEIFQFPKVDGCAAPSLVAALMHLIDLVQDGRIDMLAVVGTCPSEDGGVYTLIPPASKTDIVRLLGALTILEARIMEQMEL